MTLSSGDNVDPVELERAGAATGEERETFCRQSLAAYQVPRAFPFVGDLPRTPSGKVLRRSLCQLDGQELA